ncbi:ABC transporter permease [Anaerosporobacter faecicola]|uniref:ABC transporter permease n=1 Tax=Anaerosporobacter faecicola TaxID=2718714 RepID=UPI00143C41B3|nr:ABC transporter permease subunit [Anaerosporobacter faecicola]
MNGRVRTLFVRDFRKAMNARTIMIWVALAGMGIFFFYATGGKSNLIKNNQVSFITLFLPHMIFGSWAVLSTYYDLFSSDREHNVLDCILCSGIPKHRVMLSKLFVIVVLSLILSFLYLLPVTSVILAVSGDIRHMKILIQFLLPLWGYIMVYASMGILISVIARSSKGALIWSLAIGLVLMPRFFVMIVEGVGKALHLSTSMVENLQLLAPGVMMQALSETSDLPHFILAMLMFGGSILIFCSVAYGIFRKQDEFNYGE